MTSTFLIKPIEGIENRTANEVFDIMCSRILSAISPAPVGVTGITDAKLIEDARLAAKIMKDTGHFPTGQSILLDLANRLEALASHEPAPEPAKDGPEVVAKLQEMLDRMRDCTVCDGDGIKDNGNECGGCFGRGRNHVFSGTDRVTLDAAMRVIGEKDAEIAEKEGERDEAKDWAHNWHGQCQAVATILGLPEPEGLGHAEAVRAKFEATEAREARLRAELTKSRNYWFEVYSTANGQRNAAEARNAELVKALEKIVEGKEVPGPLDDGRSTIITDLGLDEIDQIARAALKGQSNE